MDRIPITSSDIASVGHDPLHQWLEVEFKKTDKIYTFDGVPQEVYLQLLAAKSPGKFFAANIKGKYSFTTRTR